MLIANFDDDAGVFCEESLYDVAILADVVEVDMKASLGIGEAHLQQSRDETAGRDIVSCHDPAFLNELLDGHKGISEVFGILDRRHIVAHLT